MENNIRILEIFYATNSINDGPMSWDITCVSVALYVRDLIVTSSKVMIVCHANTVGTEKVSKSAVGYDWL